jgi:membrane-bound lytic murein transglycosylase D
MMPIFRTIPAVNRLIRLFLPGLALLMLAACQSSSSLTQDRQQAAPAAATLAVASPAVVPESAAVAVAAVTDPEAPAQPVLPARIDPEDPASCCLRANLWDRIRAGFRFDLDEDNARIAAQRNWYVRNPQYLDRVIARGARYLHHIVEETEARDMPMELALLPIVESAFDPFAYSVADAAGPWQFIPSTGRVFGLRQDWWYDGRRDIVYSTAAALTYLGQYAARFDGDYYKALASYNAGGGTISRAVTRNLRAGKRTDYWSLQVPQETAAYVPKLIALAQIVRDPGKYGLRLAPIPDEPRFVQVRLPTQVDLARASELAGIPLAELYLYNPAHSRWLSDPVGPHRLLVPVEVAAELRSAIDNAEADEFAYSRPYTVQDGDTLESIAARHDLPMEALRAMNESVDGSPAAGTLITLPQPRLLIASADMTYEPRIVALNRPGKARRSSVPTTTQHYVVRRGDTLSSIARKYGVPLRDLARLNGMKLSKPLQVGQKLKVKSGGSSAVVASSSGSRKSTGKAGADGRKVHVVKRGETLSSLSRKFKVSVHDIARWNDFSPKRQLKTGERVKIYLD